MTLTTIMMIKLRGQLFALIAFIAISFSANADPKDFPPTFFQLGQVEHYVQNKHIVDMDFRRLETREVVMKYESMPWLLSKIEVRLKLLIPEPSQASHADWVSAVDELLVLIEKDKMRGDDFKLEACRRILVKAIVAEQKAALAGKVIFWRYSATSPAVEKMFEPNDFRDCALSFSWGLLSGYIFDSSQLTGACTYSYLLGKLTNLHSAQGNMLEGRKTFYEKLRTSMPGYFEQSNDFSDVYTDEMDKRLNEILFSALAWYKERYGMSDKFCEDISKHQFTRLPQLALKEGGQFREALGTVWETCSTIFAEAHYMGLLGERRHFTPYLYGVVIARDDIVKLRENKKQNFMDPHHAVYGSGELFHPKRRLSQDAEIIDLLSVEKEKLIEEARAHFFEKQAEFVFDEVDRKMQAAALQNEEVSLDYQQK